MLVSGFLFVVYSTGNVTFFLKIFIFFIVVPGGGTLWHL
jgi:hypothetical protein